MSSSNTFIFGTPSRRAVQVTVFLVIQKTMANEQNLKPFTSNQSHEEAVKNGRKGGIASGEARREKKLIKDRILERMGETDWDTMIDNLIERASNDTKSFEVLRDTIGQKPVEKHEQSVTFDSSKLDSVFNQVGGEGLKE